MNKPQEDFIRWAFDICLKMGAKLSTCYIVAYELAKEFEANEQK